MPVELLLALETALLLLAVCGCLHTVRRARRQILEMAAALEDVKNGNGNRRILSGTHALTAPLAYAVNDIVLSYEDRLCATRKTEETNRRLMTSLSHDVRTPLTTLIGYLDAACKGAVKGEERDGYVETARRKAHDLKEYIDVLFDWFRLGSDEFPLNVQTVDATELTRNILIDWVPILEEANVAYTFDIPERPFRVQTDPDGYTRILNNLIQNALSHSRADHIGLALSAQDGKMRLLLSDNGVGMDGEALRHIFDRLYTRDQGPSQRGSGLGLSIARQLAERLGGAVTADSEPGKGTVFTLLFPLAE